MLKCIEVNTANSTLASMFEYICVILVSTASWMACGPVRGCTCFCVHRYESEKKSVQQPFSPAK